MLINFEITLRKDCLIPVQLTAVLCEGRDPSVQVPHAKPVESCRDVKNPYHAHTYRKNCLTQSYGLELFAQLNLRRQPQYQKDFSARVSSSTITHSFLAGVCFNRCSGSRKIHFPEDRQEADAAVVKNEIVLGAPLRARGPEAMVVVLLRQPQEAL